MNHILAKAGILLLACWLVTTAGTHFPANVRSDNIHLNVVYGVICLAIALLFFIYSDLFANYLVRNYGAPSSKPAAFSITAVYRLPRSHFITS